MMSTFYGAKCWCHDPATDPRNDCPIHSPLLRPMTTPEQSPDVVEQVARALAEALPFLNERSVDHASKAIAAALTRPTVTEEAVHRAALALSEAGCAADWNNAQDGARAALQAALSRDRGVVNG